MVLPPGERYWNGRNVRLQTWRLDPVICLWEEAIFLPAQKCLYYVIFDLDLDLEHTLDACWPRVHRVQVSWRSGHLPARSDGQCKFSTSVQRDKVTNRLQYFAPASGRSIMIQGSLSATFGYFVLIRCLFATQAEHEYKIQIQIEIQRKNRN